MASIGKWFLTILFGISVLLVTFVLGFELIIFNDPYFRWHYENREIMDDTGMTIDGLMNVTDQMLSYLKDDVDTLDMQEIIDGTKQEVFGQREKDHMVDVKILYLSVRSVRRWAMIIFSIIFISTFFLNKELLATILSRMKYVIAVLMIFISILAGLFALDFNKYFVLFHELFFSNDLWLLDPKTDILINMVPESYFYSIVMIGVLFFVILLLLAIVLAERLKKRLVNR